MLRIGISLVFLWFGWQQVFDPNTWVSLIPEWATRFSGLSAGTLVLVNGTFELVFGSLLFLGIFTRVVAFLLALHLLHIMSVVGYNSIGVRDFGLSMGAIAVFLYGADAWCLNKK